MDYVDIGPECFTDGDVIAYKGENYYRACSEFVAALTDGGRSFCVRRAGHPGDVHEAYDGKEARRATLCAHEWIDGTFVRYCNLPEARQRPAGSPVRSPADPAQGLRGACRNGRRRRHAGRVHRRTPHNLPRHRARHPEGRP